MSDVAEVLAAAILEFGSACPRHHEQMQDDDGQGCGCHHDLASHLQPLIDAEKQQAVEEALREVVRRVEADVPDGYVWSRVVGSMIEARRPAPTGSES